MKMGRLMIATLVAVVLAVWVTGVHAAFVDNGNGTVTDTSTGLMWQQDTARDGEGNYDTMTWEEALAYCEALELPNGGYTDWRLPTIKELLSLVDYSQYDPAIDEIFRLNTVSSRYWSSTTVASSTYNAGVVDFSNGYDYWSNKPNNYYVRAVRGGQSGSFDPLIVSQSPQSGPPGTVFLLGGRGFTPNSTATVQVKAPNGTTAAEAQKAVNEWGEFSHEFTTGLAAALGSYTWSAADGVSGGSANGRFTITESLTGITTDNYYITNSTGSSQLFELWLDVAINGQKPGTDMVNHYTIDIVPSRQASGVTIERAGDCQHKGDGTLNNGNSSRYRQLFRIKNTGGREAWFENGKLQITPNGGGPPHDIDDLMDFSVYGTKFEIGYHAWDFANGSWQYVDQQHKDIWKAADTVASYVSEQKRDDFWDSVGHERWFIVPDENSHGLCYGLANAVIATFNHSGDAWGMGGIDQWNGEIEDHWAKDGGDRALSPYRALEEGRVYDCNWDFQSAKKIMYYFVGQPFYSGGELWVGDDGRGSYQMFFSSSHHREILKSGSPISFSFNKKKGTHTIAATQLITWNNNDLYILWDNNYPYPVLSRDGYGHYLTWRLRNNKNYLSFWNDVETRFIRKIGLNGEENAKVAYELASIPYYIPQEADPQNIYNMPNVSAVASAARPQPNDAIESEPGTDLPDMIELQVIGGQVTGVSVKGTGQAVTLAPNGDPSSGQAVIDTTCGGSYNFLYLPVDKTYRIDAKKSADNPFLKIFVRIPQTDGTVAALNYDDVATGETAATSVYFYVGRGNTDKAVRQLTGATSGSPQVGETLVGPDYDENLEAAIGPPQNFTALFEGDRVTLRWVNTTHPAFSKVKIVRSRYGYPESVADGTVIYEGSGQTVQDSDVFQGGIYYYAAFSRKTSEAYSEAAYAQVNTWLYSIYGRVTVGGNGLAGVALELKDAAGNDVAVTTTGADGRYSLANLEMNPYELSASCTGHVISNPTRQVSLSNQNVEVNFTATPIPALKLLFGLTAVQAGQTYDVPWSYQNVANSEKVNLSLCSGGTRETLAENVPILNGRFSWKARGAALTSATLKLSLASNPNVYDEHGLIVNSGLPTVTTASVTNITPTTARSGGNVTSDGGADVTARGVCWGTSAHPTTAGPHTSNGTGEGSFTSQLTGLTQGTLYYVCAYATNSQGRTYGSDVSFTTLLAGMRYVHPSGSCGGYQPCYSTIQSAIDAAVDGDTVLVSHGDYYESIVLDDAKSLNLLCGRNDTFGPSTLFSTAYDLEIERGSLIVERLHLVSE